MALTTLLYLGKEGLTEQVVRKIASTVSMEELKKLMPCEMPNWRSEPLSYSS